MWGITAEVARRFGYAGPMRDMPRATALAIYRRRYFSGPGFDKVAGLSEPIASEMFDTGVNMGPAVAVTFLQTALNALNRSARDYPDIAIDGDLGPATLQALGAYLQFRGGPGVTVLLRALNGQQLVRYLGLARRPANEDFMFGWIAQRVA
jgi:lysozyme family protein